MKLFLFSCGLLLIFSAALSQDNEIIDSLLSLSRNSSGDSVKSEIYYKIGGKYMYNTPDTAIYYFKRSISHAKHADLKQLHSKSLNSLGIVYKNQSKYQKAIELFLSALDINKELNEEKQIGYNYLNIGNVFSAQNENGSAIKYYKKAVIIFEKIENKNGLAKSQNNLGTMYETDGDHENALLFYNKAYRTFSEINNTRGASVALNNLGNINKIMGNLNDAYYCYEKSLKYRKLNNDKIGESLTLSNLAQISNDLGRYYQALNYLDSSLILAEETENMNSLLNIYLNYSRTFNNISDFKKAYTFLNRSMELKDSLYGVDKQMQISELEKKYQTVENEKKLLLQETELANQKAENEKRKSQMNLIFAGLVLFVLLAGLIFLGYRTKRKSNIQLAIQNEQILQQNEEIKAQHELTIKQKDLISVQNKEITDSIHYARRIQTAIMPYEEILEKRFNEYFILYRPKDIVSGDFYWFSEVEGSIIVASADCTGHGVPGAFMSMLGIAFLKEIINKEYIIHPGVILRKLRKEIIRALHQENQFIEQKDGMDIALCSINLEKQICQFSGANSPLYIIRNGKLIEFKGDKMPIAIYDKMDNFETHEITLQKDDIIYMFTDGYVDQFGGENARKFMYKPFKNLLITISHLSLKEQKKAIDNAFIKWKGNHDQIDDVLVIGIKI